MSLSHDDRERLAKLLAMFSSTFDGEILNAAKAAERLIRNRGETWETIIVVAFPTGRQSEQTARPKPQPHRSDFQEEIDKCQERESLLTDWERNFLTSISERWSLSEKQRTILDRIKEKLSRYEGMDF